MFGLFKKKAPPAQPFTPLSVSYDVPDLTTPTAEQPKAYAGQTAPSPAYSSWYDGEKFPGGFGDTQIQTLDYWTLRQRSNQLFNENQYASGIIDRLITNEIGRGLFLGAQPPAEKVGLSEDAVGEWGEEVETDFTLWGSLATSCDFREKLTFAGLTRSHRREALVNGDILVVVKQDRRTRMPRVQLIKGDQVRTPLDSINLQDGREIIEGVEIDQEGRHLAFHVTQKDGSSLRIAARGRRSGRLQAWLVYGHELLVGEVRGRPLLSRVLQSLKEIDRYRDSTQRKSTNNSFLNFFIEKTEDKIGSSPVTGGAVVKGEIDATQVEGGRSVTTSKLAPGTAFQEMQHGEKVHMFGGQGTDEQFGTFEAAIIQGVAWTLQIPPEILTLSFSNNYSASQAAINEFKIYLDAEWSRQGETFCAPIYREWLVNKVLKREIEAPGLIEAWRDPAQRDTFAAWTSSEWLGAVKPSTDMLKQVNGSREAIALGLSTHAREARKLTGSKFSKNAEILKRENALLVAAMAPLREAEAQAARDSQPEPAEAPEPADGPQALTDDDLELIDELVDEYDAQTEAPNHA